MSSDRPGVRPRVLLPETAADLDEYLAFRHRYRNLYMFDLRWEPMRTLLERAPEVWARVRADLLTFVEALEQIAGLERRWASQPVAPAATSLCSANQGTSRSEANALENISASGACIL
jgi:hypothetical protein